MALWFAGVSMTLAAQAGDASASLPTGNAPGALSAPMAIQVNDDRMTLAVAKVPQVYLYGTIDAGAPQRFEALLKSGKVPAGSDIYLNSPGGDLAAGLALGRLFRANRIGTHLGVPRRVSRESMTMGPREAQCVDACAYAYFGGLYRWAPTGNDRFGALPAAKHVVPESEIGSYLQQMGIRPDLLVPPASTAPEDARWLSGERMVATGLANNGYQQTTAIYQPMDGSSSLQLSQLARDGEHRITLLCRPDGMTVTAHYIIGAERSRKIAARVTRSYFEIDEQPTPQEEHGAVSTVDQSLVFSHPVPVDQVTRLLTARTMGAWLTDRGGAVRYGFLISLNGVQNNLRDYSASCQQLAKAAGGGKQAPHG